MAFMWWEDLSARLAASEAAAARMQVELVSLRHQLDHAQSEGRGLRAAALEDARDSAADRREMVRLHRQQLEEQQLQHQQELAAAVAAATAAETTRMQAEVQPTLLLLQESTQAALVELGAVQAELKTTQSELGGTRALVYEAVVAPAATRRRLGY
jgi:hypothetical protein